jgi:F-type H+-transporting ATPase subunit alpha
VTSGSLVSHTGERLEIGVGDALLGRVIDPLGKPLDGLASPEPDGVCALEAPSPPIVARDSVSRPLYTGIKVIDILIPIGRGQRELIIGDSGTGKTSLALDSIISQAGQQVNCVYVSIGQKRSETALVLDILRRRGASRTRQWWWPSHRHAGHEVSGALRGLRRRRGLDAPRQRHAGGLRRTSPPMPEPTESCHC